MCIIYDIGYDFYIYIYIYILYIIYIYIIYNFLHFDTPRTHEVLGANAWALRVPVPGLGSRDVLVALLLVDDDEMWGSETISATVLTLWDEHYARIHTKVFLTFLVEVRERRRGSERRTAAPRDVVLLCSSLLFSSLLFAQVGQRRARSCVGSLASRP